MSAAEQVAALLARSDMTKSALSGRSGVSRSLIDDYLKGRRQPTLVQLERLGRAAGFRLDVGWTKLDLRPTPHWAHPNPAMAPMELTVAERAKVLERVVPIAMNTRRRARGDLEFPPFRTLRNRAEQR